jgi:hypothetical protein
VFNILMHTCLCVCVCVLIVGVLPGDSLFFHFSGHGSQQPDPLGIEEDGMNEVILPG